MSTREPEKQLDKDKAKRNLQTILERMHTDTDINQLHEYHRLYKKEISIFKRSWAAAWLFMYYDRLETPRAKAADKMPEKAERQRKAQSAKAEKAAKPDRNNTAAAAEYILTEEESKRLFISIGKNRRLFPREVISLIMSKTSAAREDIGVIRILDNYSFVQVRDSKADEIIETLTGVKFRGRTLTVNFAKPKTAESDSE